MSQFNNVVKLYFTLTVQKLKFILQYYHMDLRENGVICRRLDVFFNFYYYFISCLTIKIKCCYFKD